MIDECDLARAGLQNTGSRNDELAAQWRGDIDVHVHAGLQRNTGIAHDETHTYRARSDVDMRKDLIDTAAEFAPRIGVHRYLGAVAGLETANVDLRHVGVDPYGGKIGNGVELCLWLHIRIGQCIALDDVAGGRRIDCDLQVRGAALVEMRDFCFGYAEVPQAVCSGLQEPVAFICRHAVHISEKDF